MAAALQAAQLVLIPYGVYVSTAKTVKLTSKLDDTPDLRQQKHRTFKR